MQLKHLKTVLNPQDASCKVTALCWSFNNSKLAVCTIEKVVLLYDENGEKKDKFSTKPANPDLGKKSYQVSGLAFSPDSTRLAVGQTDNIVYVYKIGDHWGEKKVICNKIILQSAVTCIVWPYTQASFVIGTADGKVKFAGSKGNKPQTLYDQGSYVVSLVSSPSGKGVLCGHADGSIIRYTFEGDSSDLSKGQVCKHSCAPYALSWTSSSIMAAGCDRRVKIYSQKGKALQQFDYSRDEDEKEFMCSAVSPSGQSVVIGSFDRLRIYNWSVRKEMWEESLPKNITNLYTITALSWRRDGSKITTGSLCGAVDMFDCYLKRVIYKNKFELTYVGPSQVIVKNVSTCQRISLKSHHEYEIEKVDIMGKDRYIVGHTISTLLVGDMNNRKLSEIMWSDTGGNEKYYFDNNNICLIFNAGELSIVEYGVNDILGSVRTELMNPHLISVRVNERKQKDIVNSKRLAYLVDSNTICISDLCIGITMGTINHDTKLNWLELNETGTKLLYRDKKLKLHLYDIETEITTPLLSYCSFVQWVPQSDVIIAQNRTSLCIWYNIDMPDNVTLFPIRGDITGIVRNNGKSEVVVQSGIETTSYTLDEGMIEFGTAIDDGDYLRALTFLESLESSSEAIAMWKTLAELTLQEGLLKIAERCFAAVGDISKTRYLRDIIEIADTITADTQQDGTKNYLVQAKIAVLNKQFKHAERILVEKGNVQQAIDMYLGLHKWEEAIAVAELTSHPDLEGLKGSYLQWLLDTGQDERAGELREKEGDYHSAVSLYLKSGLPIKAARLVLHHQDLSSQLDLLLQIASVLLKTGLYERAGELYERARSYQDAMEAYRKGGAFRKAIELARNAFPSEVVSLEEQWGDRLCIQKQYDNAIVHYIESGNVLKAIESAIKGRQWLKASQIVETQEHSIAGPYYKIIGDHFASVKKYKEAEEFYLKGQLYKETVQMYIKADQWEPAYRTAVDCMETDEVKELYVSKARQLEDEGRLKEAERLYILVQEPDLAISMYKNKQQYDPMLKLVSRYHPDLLIDTHIHLAKELESQSLYRQCEYHYIQGKEWKGAVNMYRAHNLWDDAYRVAKAEGGSNAANQVAYLWAKSLGGESAVKLLTKFSLLEAAVDYATDNQAFEFAFEIAKLSIKSKIPEIHLKYALSLEDEGKFSLAEEEFLRADRPKEAVLMYVHQKDWDSAQRIAESYSPESVSDVYVGQARIAFQKKDFQKAEALLLRADRPDLAASFYKEADMWPDTLRIVKEYLPHKLDELQKEMASNSGNNYEDILLQASTWEEGGEYSRAIETLLQLTINNCDNQQILLDTWTKAVDLCKKFVTDKLIDVIVLVCDRLANIGHYSQGGEMFLSVKMVKEAIDMFISGEEWDKARHITKNVDPRYEKYVENSYIEYLKERNRPDEMQSVDPVGALKMYMDSGEWDKCLELAQQQGPTVIAKYVALYSAHLIKTNSPLLAVQLFCTYGAPASPQNYNIYKRLCQEIFMNNNEDIYKNYANLRDMLLQLVDELYKTSNSSDPIVIEFDRYLLISHYLATRCACKTINQLNNITSKLSVSLLRYTDVIPADKTFYEAGQYLRSIGEESMAFIFFNRFLDLSEAIEEGSLDMLDNTDFLQTDIPFEIPLPEEPFLTESKREDIKEWVLALSMDTQVQQTLPVDERQTYVGSLTSPHTGVSSLPCVITGYPVLSQKVEFKKKGRSANRSDWTKFIMITKSSQNEDCMDVLRFIGKWSGQPVNPAHAFM